MKRKSSSGRQKIPIEKIPKKSHLQVTFSKRRSGLFKKASELCTLCGVEIAIIVFSPADKAFSFGHPEVESIIDRYLSRNPPSESGAHPLVEAHRNANVRELNMQLTQLLGQVETERKKGEEMEQVRKARQRQFWWENPIEELGFDELQQLVVAMEELKKNLGKMGSKMLMEHNSLATESSVMGMGGTNGGLGRYNNDVFEYKHGAMNNISAASSSNILLPHHAYNNLNCRHGYL
ncbi:agamous-like MADS-box protein AGL61 [Prosopis cineraria]|uniref:agamous-like MADS-box protein AGL61 n=1 Tax=Prosopis cineraria TaxID=364024 RepID=UPI002410B58E|nr:agamous-like MADS-box protein AGL61 [Prosopis cineraria]